VRDIAGTWGRWNSDRNAGSWDLERTTIGRNDYRHGDRDYDRGYRNHHRRY
jgi:hypothetical protein